MRPDWIEKKEMDRRWEAFVAAMEARQEMPTKELNDYMTALCTRIGYAIGGVARARAPFIAAVLRAYSDDMIETWPEMKGIVNDLLSNVEKVTVRIPKKGEGN